MPTAIGAHEHDLYSQQWDPGIDVAGCLSSQQWSAWGRSDPTSMEGWMMPSSIELLYPIVGEDEYLVESDPIFAAPLPSVRGTIDVTLRYVGRSRPIPVSDPRTDDDGE